MNVFRESDMLNIYSAPVFPETTAQCKIKLVSNQPQACLCLIKKSHFV